MGALLTPRPPDVKSLDTQNFFPGSLGGGALCSVPPARRADSFFTCAERSTAQARRYALRVRGVFP